MSRPEGARIDDAGDGATATTDALLRARNVRKSFGAEGVLRGIDLDVYENELLVLLGPNGVGKTVLLSSLAGGTTPTDGTVEVFGRPIGSRPGEHTVFMRQSAMAIDSLTGRENVQFYGRLHPAFTDRWREYVARLGIDDELDKRVRDYSGGMKRKLEFAIALSVDVDVYLLDEPTAGVDLSMIQRFHDCILERREAGATFVVTSHLPTDVELADRIAFMRDGAITETGRPDDLMDAVPPVVRVDGARAANAATEHVRGGDLFREGAEARGFLRPGTDVEAIAAAVDDAHVVETRPTYTDLFNYCVHVRGEQDE